MLPCLVRWASMLGQLPGSVNASSSFSRLNGEKFSQENAGHVQGFNLKMLKHLVLDEADRLLNMDFEEEIDHILKAIPKVCLP